MTKEEKANILHQEARALYDAYLMVGIGQWQNGRSEVAAIAERLLYYVQETDLEDTSRENIIRQVQSITR